jgi:CBS domain-containing protein
MTTHHSPATPPAEVLSRIPVRDAMQLGLFHCDADDDITEVVRLMAEQSIHSVVIAGIATRDHSGDHLAWGIVSDLDLMRALAPGADGATAAEVAGTEIVTISPRGSLATAVQLMAEHETAHLVVVSPDTGRPVGMLSTLDVVRAADGA